VKGGYTNAKAKLTYDDGTGPLSGHDDLDGWRAGAGVEFAVAPHIAMRCESRYSDFGDYHFAGVNTGLSVQRHQGVVAVIGKF
jgi:outer membrane immunogenic protein